VEKRIASDFRRNRARAIARALLVALAWAALGSRSAQAQAQPATITWKGIQWNVKSGTKNPGHNNWSAANAFVDADGDLHLAVTNVGGTWYCAEVWTNATFPFGTFQWQVKTAVDALDPNVVLGLFLYGPPALGPDGTHEIDIEYSRFGSAATDNGRWTVWPDELATPPVLGRVTFPLALGADPTSTSRFTWSPARVAYGTLAGYQPPDSSTGLSNSWTYAPDDPGTSISQSPMPVHMNLWLYNGAPPTNGQGVEVVIHDFSSPPASTANAVPALRGNRVLILVACLLGAGAFSVRRSGSLLANKRS
jgi:hypothetical protein